MTAHYVYRCYGEDGRLVYVGCTQNLAGRLANHRSTSFWAPYVVKVRASVYPTKAAGRAAEAKAIRHEDPRFNCLGRWITHATWTAEQYRDYCRALTHLSITAYTLKHIDRVERMFADRFGEPISTERAA